MSIITITATDDAAGTRIEKWLAANDELGITRNRADTLVRGGNVSINGKNIIKTYKLKSGDLISIDIKSALLALDELTGEVVTDEVLNNIFDNFCIGK